jgi:uncharacterized membrane protein
VSPLEDRAWLALWSMCPPYLIYFALQVGSPAWPATMLERIGCLAAASLTHVVIFILGLLWLKRREREQGLFADERDRAIQARATAAAYIVLLIGAVVAGMVMPFSQGGWKIVNAVLLATFVAEVVRYALIVLGYRGGLHVAHG